MVQALTPPSHSQARPHTPPLQSPPQSKLEPPHARNQPYPKGQQSRSNLLKPPLASWMARYSRKVNRAALIDHKRIKTALLPKMIAHHRPEIITLARLSRNNSLTDVHAIQKQLKEAGIAFEQEATEGTGPACFLIHDPDGNPILVDQHVASPQ